MEMPKDEVLVSVVCNGLEADFAVKARCIYYPRSQGKVFTPRDFEVLAGQGHYKNWKQSIRMDLKSFSGKERTALVSHHDNNAKKGEWRGIPLGKWMEKNGYITKKREKANNSNAPPQTAAGKRKRIPTAKVVAINDGEGEPKDAPSPSPEATRTSSRVVKSVYSRVGRDVQEGKEKHGRFRSMADLTGLNSESKSDKGTRRTKSSLEENAGGVLALAQSIEEAREAGLVVDTETDPEESVDVLELMERVRGRQHFRLPSPACEPSTVSALDVEIEKRLEEIRMEEDRVRKEGIRGLLRKAKGFRLQPFRYMVSWNGVLVLAFTGFPGIVLKLKNGLNKFEHLVKENPGSTWPKCTLAALNDNQRLSPEQLQRLNSICLMHNCKGILDTLVEPKEYVKKAIGVKSLSLTVFECRNHERVLMEEEFPLGESFESTAEGEKEDDKFLFKVNKEERERMFHLCEETRDVNKYWFHASKDGNRISHYREPKIGSSLVTWLNKAENAKKLLEDISHLRHKIEDEFPDLYTFFDYDSLHVTIRAVS